MFSQTDHLRSEVVSLMSHDQSASRISVVGFLFLVESSDVANVVFVPPAYQSGEIDVVNHTTGDRCHLKFNPYSYFSRDVPRKVRLVQEFSRHLCDSFTTPVS